MKGSLVRAEDTFVSKTCEREGDEEGRNVEESLDLGNGVHFELANPCVSRENGRKTTVVVLLLVEFVFYCI